MSAVTPAPSSGAPNANILSEKVQRALQVRTDTPAMKAALDALAHLGGGSSSTTMSGSESKQDDNGGGGDFVVVDSRSVRVAIEQDALQQALLLQAELQTLVTTVAALRQGVSDTAAIADRLYQGIQTDVTATLQTPPEHPLLPPAVSDNNNNSNNDDSDDDGSAPAPTTSQDAH